MPGGSGWLIAFLLVSAALIFGAYYLTRFIGGVGRQSSRFGAKLGQGRHIRVIESVPLSRDKLVCLVEVRGKAYLVAVAASAVTLLDTMDADAFAEPPRRTMSFAVALRSVLRDRFGAGGGMDADEIATRHDGQGDADGADETDDK